MRRIVYIVIFVALLAAGGFFLFQRQQQIAETPTFEIIRRANVTRDRIQSTVNATGSIEPEALVNLTFGLGGTVQEVNVVRGQEVRAGDVLATLNTDELALAVQQARDALRIQELTLAQRQNSAPSAATLASAQADIDAAEAGLLVAQANVAGAEASLLQAQAQRAQLLAPPTAGAVAAAELDVTNAQQALQNAEETHNQTLQCFTINLPGGGSEERCPGLGAPEEAARAAVLSARAALDVAEVRLADVRTGPRAADIQAADATIASAEANLLAAQGNVASAEANVARAEAAYARLLEPPTVDELAILEAQVASGGTNLALAELRLAQATVVAPLDGTVASVAINPGEIASPGVPVVTLLNEDAFHIDVRVDEIDVDRLEVGQTVAVTLDALPEQPIDGRIAEIAPTAARTSGVVTYLVTINIADAPIPLRAGMSANAAIVVEEIGDVLTVPNWAVRLDRETGEAFVNRLNDDGTVSEVPVETGLRNDTLSEVLRGLAEGDEVVVTNEREGISFFGGGGG